MSDWKETEAKLYALPIHRRNAPIFTQRHYEAIVKVIRAYSMDDTPNMVAGLRRMLMADNANFDVARFDKALRAG